MGPFFTTFLSRVDFASAARQLIHYTDPSKLDAMRTRDLFFRCFFSVAVLFAAPPAGAQQAASPAKSEYEEQLNHPAAPAYSTELTEQLVALRDAALSDNYAYEQVRYLTENIGARPEGSARRRLASNMLPINCANWALMSIWNQ
jgi:hypothetical protein